MIDAVSTAVPAIAARGIALVHYVVGLPVRGMDMARAAHAVVLAGPVPTVKPSAPPGSAKILTVLGWVGWGVFAASIAGVLLICIKMATSSHRSRGGEGGGEEAGKLFWPLLACIVGSSAGSILGVVA